MSNVYPTKIVVVLYWLKQFSLVLFVVLYGYTQSMSDCSLFTKSTNTSFIALTVYVDDIILAGNVLKEIEKIKVHLHEHFTIKILAS